MLKFFHIKVFSLIQWQLDELSLLNQKNQVHLHVFQFQLEFNLELIHLNSLIKLMSQPLRVEDFVDELRKYERKEDFMTVMH